MNTERISMKPGKPGHREGGAILIVTLLFLVILTMLGVTAMTGTTMEERMAGNTRDSSIALQAAESVLRDARRDISRMPVGAGFGRPIPPIQSDFGDAAGTAGSCNTDPLKPGLCRPANNPDGTPYTRIPPSVLPSIPAAYDLQASPSVQFGAMTGAPAVGDAQQLPVQPRYLLEIFCLREQGQSLGAQDFCNFYRITARGYGRNPNTQVTLQEMFVSLE
jgi:type IV pilus assembly protein PilX